MVVGSLIGLRGEAEAASRGACRGCRQSLAILLEVRIADAIHSCSGSALVTSHKPVAVTIDMTRGRPIGRTPSPLILA